MPASADAITNAYEFFICLHPTGDALKSNHTYTQNTFQTAVYSQNEFKGTHDAVMHPEACNFILHNFVKKGALVLDPFSGTGTTPICCIKNKMNYYGIEKDPEYYDLSLKKHTAKYSPNGNVLTGETMKDRVNMRLEPGLWEKAEKWGNKQKPKLNKTQVVETALYRLMDGK